VSRALSCNSNSSVGSCATVDVPEASNLKSKFLHYNCALKPKLIVSAAMFICFRARAPRAMPCCRRMFDRAESTHDSPLPIVIEGPRCIAGT
jgi:hypothetical protein